MTVEIINTQKSSSTALLQNLILYLRFKTQKEYSTYSKINI